ncbi:MAG: hypothetical protein EOO88_32055, partial [Pedobacter sp.]
MILILSNEEFHKSLIACSIETVFFVNNSSNVTFSKLLEQSSRVWTVTAAASHKDLRCRLIADDGYNGTRESSASSSVEILNTAPVVPKPQIAPGTYATGFPVSCSVAPAASDVDEDALSLIYNWYSFSGSVSIRLNYTGPTIVLNGEGAHENLACRVTASDIYGGTTQSDYSDQVTYVNTLPNDFNVITTGPTSPAVLKVGQSIDCSGTPPTDPDHDSVSAISFKVTKKALLASAWTDIIAGSSFVASSSEAHQYLRCEGSVTDGYGTKAGTAGSGIMVENTAPVLVGSHALTDVSQGKVSETITCSAEATDADSDTLTKSYTWLRKTENGSSFSVIPGASSQSYIITKHEAHGEVSCRVTIADGYGGTVTTEDSAPVTILNTPPMVITSTVVTSEGNGSVKFGGWATCNEDLIAKDVDDDELTVVTYKWFDVSTGVPLSGFVTKTISYLSGTSPLQKNLQCSVVYR